ncbi:MAG: adenylyl-sulfate kinase [Chloroflexi bacterium]|nr:adenylyl-sulfate kinase [Chloroflexota bacterium]
MPKIIQVVKRTGAIVPFNQDRIANAIYRAAVAEGGRDKDRADWLADEVVRELEMSHTEGQIPHIEEIQDMVEKVLIENGHASVAKAYILYRDERKRGRKKQDKHAVRAAGNIPWAKIWHVLDWSVSNGLHTVTSLNERIEKGEFPNIVNKSEAAYEQDVDIAARLIAERKHDVRVVLVTGPSSSGKTTTTIKLEQRLQKSGLKFVTLNVDNYFFDLELHPKDEFGDYDFETPQALDMILFNKNLAQLIDGREALIPFYDFKTGKSHPEQTAMRLQADEVLLIDSLHGLYPALTETVPDERKYKLYLEPLLQMKGSDGRYIRWTDLRLIRRMLRDQMHRAYDPRRTLEHWHYVRASEMRNIIPYHNTADYVINSAMPYELALYKARVYDWFVDFEKRYDGDPLREDAYTRARRVKNLLQAIVPVADDEAVPRDSVLREFVGGSSLEH